jgi:hypothetical protein
MSTIRIALFSSAFLACTIACSAAPDEPQGRIEQRIEVAEDAGAGDAEADGETGGESACTHALCATGTALAPPCDPCATALCALDPYCCTTAWDATCVGEVSSICGASCSAPPTGGDAGASTCAHPVCATGAPLASACESCATTLCAQDPYCCAVSWDATCVGEVGAICGQACQ